jgi:hypothetical protein
MLHQREHFQQMINDIKRDGTSGKIEAQEEGYSSMEIPEPQQAAAEQEVHAVEAEEPVEEVHAVEAEEPVVEEKSFYEEAAEEWQEAPKEEEAPKSFSDEYDAKK